MWLLTGIYTSTCFSLLAALFGLGCGQDISGDYRENHFTTSTPGSSFFAYDRSPRATSLAQRSCLAPPQPENGQWRLHRDFCEDDSADCEIPEGTELGLRYELIYTCNAGYEIEGNSAVLCRARGGWVSIPVCREIRCEPLNTVSRSGHCSRFGENVNCDFPSLPITRAEVSCLPGYRQDLTVLSLKRNIVYCSDNGQWQPPPISCVPVCGQAVTRQWPYVINGSDATIGDFPWHATLYREQRSQKENKKEFKCGGTIIRANLVMTAAHCVYDETRATKEDADRYFVMTGNADRDFDHPKHNLDIVRQAAVKHIHMHFSFHGLRGNYGSDIALLELEKPFVFSEILLPACLDTSGYNAPYLETGAYGKLAGFGITATGETSETLQTLTLPYVSHDNCRESKNAQKNDVFLTKDKFCAGYTNGSAVCEGDSGGGLVFLNNGKWYVMGIVSVGLGVDLNNGARTCDRYAYTLYTRVSDFAEWILEVISNMERDKQRPASNPNTNHQSFATMTLKLTPISTTPRTTTSLVTSAVMPSSGCLAPLQPENGEWKIAHADCKSVVDADENCKVRPNVKLEPGTQLLYSCNANYRFVRNGLLRAHCFHNGNWSTLHPGCEAMRCSPFNNLTTMATCRSRTGDLVACDVPVLPRTQADLQCRFAYIRRKIPGSTQGADQVICNENGKWEPDPIECIQDCGRTRSPQPPLVVGSTEARAGDFPWHATLYRYNSDPRYGSEKSFKCGATIINPNLLVTNARCVNETNPHKTIKPEELFIAAGNVFRDYDSPLHDPATIQKRAVKKVSFWYSEIRRGPQYGLIEWDIAFLEVKEPLIFSETVSPVCLDCTNMDDLILKNGALGRIPGFDELVWDSNNSTLQAITVPYLTNRQCGTAGSHYIRINDDQFCAGEINGTDICVGLRGGGLVSEMSDQWYLFGIADMSVGARRDRHSTCYTTPSPTLYNKVSYLSSWIQGNCSTFAQD